MCVTIDGRFGELWALLASGLQYRCGMTTTSLVGLREQRALMIKYLDHKRELGDWHGVMDAAADIRELEAKIAVLEAFEKKEIQP